MHAVFVHRHGVEIGPLFSHEEEEVAVAWAENLAQTFPDEISLTIRHEGVCVAEVFNPATTEANRRFASWCLERERLRS